MDEIQFRTRNLERKGIQFIGYLSIIKDKTNYEDLIQFWIKNLNST